MDWGCLLFCIVFSISTSAGSAPCLQRVPVLKQCSEMSLLLPPFVLPGKKKKIWATQAEPLCSGAPEL